ncbi:restriction endonuclease subunit S [Lamprobacter modestohalophilus]|uniref:restriction endonuclease subunit S n=1 Tax=Lamprobacter modestohalophilus TaxID=1064514 RepID=UPI002ADEE8C9|nr:restriction endonuclease subunit S [Lamprobacter modestohalophilus]MEA1049445.1 restriction endonuclease subunit S [Lamprobacter modestohalophilus]
MKTSWHTKTIGELCLQGGGKVQTGPFGSQLHQSDYSDDGTPVVMPADISTGRIDTRRIVRVSESHVQRLSRHKLKLGDIVYGRRGDIGRQALVREENVGWLCGTGCLRIRLGSSDLDSAYLHRYLNMPEVIGWIEGQAIGATMPNLNTNILYRVPVRFPDLETQKKIIAILTAYDDLIETNKRRIALLEKMAEGLYREWFVRMRFPGHQNTKFVKGVPERWSFDLGSKFFDHVKGKSYSSPEISDEEGSCFFITLKSFHRRGGYRKEGLKYYSGSYKDDQCVQAGDVVMAVTDMTQDRAVVGEVARIPSLPGKQAVISLDVIRLLPKEMSTTFLYAYMRHSGFANYIKEFAALIIPWSTVAKPPQA